MEESAHGLVLRVRPLTETSLIVHWLTRDHGRIATVAKGARRSKSSFRGKIDLFFESDFSFVRSRRSELHTLREAVPTNTFPNIRTGFERLDHAAYAVKLVELATETETPVPEFFALLVDWFQRLDRQAASRSMLLGLEWRLLGLCGLAADPVSLPLSPEALALLIALEADAPHSEPSRAAARELGRNFSRPLEEQLNRLPEARARLLFE
jgi:DNA repair protein RecO (recombination protein O)